MNKDTHALNDVRRRIKLAEEEIAEYQLQLTELNEIHRMLDMGGWFCLVVVALGAVMWPHVDKIRAQFFGAM